MRNRHRKTERPDENAIEMAMEAVEEGSSVRGAAIKFGIASQTLRDRLQGKAPKSVAHVGQQVFNVKQEQELRNYLVKSAKMFYGLNLLQLRRLAFQFAQKLKAAKYIKKIPASWFPKGNNEEPAASRDWAEGFMKRHPDLSLRRPVSTSLGRAAAFNSPVVQKFFDLYENIRKSHEYTAATVWNMDETGLNTVHKTKYVLAQKGQRCVASASSGERGTNVTLAMAVSAAGEKIPPFFIYPRVKMQDRFLMHGSEDAKGVANGSGWQTAETYVQFIHHFIKYAIKAGTQRTLLINDNHESHLSIEALSLCKENNIDVLTLPPHTSHKLQPLDRGVFGPFKAYFGNACNAWMFNHPNVPIGIQNVAELVAEPILKGASSINIISGFRSTGIWPFNRDIFTEDDFLSSSVTDRPYEDVHPASLETSIDQDRLTLATSIEPETPAQPFDLEIPGTSVSSPTNVFNEQLMQRNVSANVEILTDKIDLEILRPLPKAAARTASSRGRKRRTFALLTSPEMMDSLRAEQESSAQKRKNQETKKQLAANKKIEKEVVKRQKAAEKSAKIAAKTTTETAPKRKRGRPCVARNSETESAKIVAKTTTETAVKRKRGRPCIVRNSETDEDADEVIVKHRRLKKT